jgi:predicted Zn-dependent protease
MEKEVGAAVAAAKKDNAAAEQLLKEAVAIEVTLDASSGPVEPIKPSFEMYGELLLEQGRLKDAAAQFEQSLTRTPNRRLSVQGLQRATAQRSTAQH